MAGKGFVGSNHTADDPLNPARRCPKEMGEDVAKRVFIKTYGCQMNVYDSARMAELLAPLGFVKTEAVEEADLVILNTCHIREKAAEKVYSELGQVRRLKMAKARRGGAMMIAVGGCVAQAEGEELQRRAPFVDLVFGPQTYHRLPELLARADRAEGAGVIDTSFPAEPKFDSLPSRASRSAVTAFLTVQEGCDKFCTFCVVPYTRGAEYSRPVMEVVAEARRLVAAGAREITLLGQNVNAYHGRDADGESRGLGDLVRRLAEIPGLDRIRYTTSHLRDVDDGLVAAHRDVPQLMPYLHLPVQSGSDPVLAAMNRRHTADDYRRVVERLRRARPDLALSSDFIVGFPGESEADFAATLALVAAIGFAQAFSFKYSRRPGTPAAALRQVPETVKEERLAVLQDLLRRQQRQFNEACIGRALPVLLEKPGRHPGQLVGRSPYLQSVYVRAAAERCGAIVTARITGAGQNSLSGILAPVEAPPGNPAGARAT
jgi:tRNA-2-methylthio-N6-dimethylallyladenosine synthase